MQLHRLVEDDPFPAIFGDPAGWRRSYGRIDARGHAVLLYDKTRDGHDIRAVIVGEGGKSVAGLGPYTLAHWTSDPALPHLHSLCARRPHIVPIRYRPGKRCTIKLARGKGLFVKALADERGEGFLRDARALWSASRQGQFGFAVARPAGWLPGMRMIVHHTVPGAPVGQALRGPLGAALAARMGAANATLAASALRPATDYGYDWQLRRTAKYAKRIGRRLPAAAPLLQRIMGRLADVSPGMFQRPIHGAPHLHQWLIAGEHLALVDFDRFGLGDPELDAATFIAEADFEDGFDGIGEAYRQGFEREVPLDGRLVEAYRLQKHVAKALRLLSAIRLDAEEQTLAVLARAARRAECLT